MEIKYREATLEDAKQLFDLSYKFTQFNAESSGEYKEFFPPNWENDFMEDIVEQLADPITNAIYLALDEAKVVGYIHAYYCEKCYQTIINELYILNEYRGKKIGEELIKRAEKFCEQFDVPMRVEVFTWNDKAIEFYLRNNYKKTTVVLEKIK